MWTCLLYRWKEEAFVPAPPEHGPGGTNATVHRNLQLNHTTTGQYTYFQLDWKIGVDFYFIFLKSQPRFPFALARFFINRHYIWSPLYIYESTPVRNLNQFYPVQFYCSLSFFVVRKPTRKPPETMLINSLRRSASVAREKQQMIDTRDVTWKIDEDSAAVLICSLGRVNNFSPNLTFQFTEFSLIQVMRGSLSQRAGHHRTSQLLSMLGENHANYCQPLQTVLKASASACRRCHTNGLIVLFCLSWP